MPCCMSAVVAIPKMADDGLPLPKHDSLRDHCLVWRPHGKEEVRAEILCAELRLIKFCGG